MTIEDEKDKTCIIYIHLDEYTYIYVEWINIMIEGDKINKIKGKKVWNDEKLWDRMGGVVDCGLDCLWVVVGEMLTNGADTLS